MESMKNIYKESLFQSISKGEVGLCMLVYHQEHDLERFYTKA